MCRRSLPDVLLFSAFASPPLSLPLRAHTHTHVNACMHTAVGPSKAIVTAVQEKDGGLRQCVQPGSPPQNCFGRGGAQEGQRGIAFVNKAEGFAPNVI